MVAIEQKIKLLKRLNTDKIPKEKIIQFLHGEKGDPGERGLPGKDGKDGLRGLQGLQGDPGKNGTDGWDGSPGTPGVKGPEGGQGIQGIPGEKGEIGERGRRGTPGAGGSSRLRITPSDGDIILGDRDQVILAEGDIFVTLPVGTDGKTYYIKNIGTGTITVIGTIDDDTNFELIQHEVIQVVFYEGWWII